MKLSELAKLVEGELVGEDLEISSLSTLELGQKNQLGYVADNKFLTLLENSSIAAVIVNQKLENCDQLTNEEIKEYLVGLNCVSNNLLNVLLKQTLI